MLKICLGLNGLIQRHTHIHMHSHPQHTHTHSGGREMVLWAVNIDGNLTAVCVLEIYTLLELMNESVYCSSYAR